MNDAARAADVALSVRLREATRDAHEHIESSLDLLRPGLLMEQYTRLLERWHGFEATWQRLAPIALVGSALADRPVDARPAGGPPGRTLPGADLSSFLVARRKLQLLRADLLACGRDAATVDALPTVPDDAVPLSTPSAALGVLYVVEGSTLGGQHVAKFVRGELGLTPQHGLAYFSSYGPDVGARWRETKRLIDTPPFAADAGAAIAAANATFACLGGWLADA